jgi:hypothetical protein
MINKLKLLRKKNKGQNFVEMALILPVLVIILMGMIEIAFLVHSTYLVATSAREGARFASRGMHLDIDEIVEITQASLEQALFVDMDGADANTRIWVTYIDIDPTGMLGSPDTDFRGDLVVPSRICTSSPCLPEEIDVTAIVQENIDFSADPERCNDAVYGCRNDLVIVEVYYDHELKMATPFVDFFLNVPVRINQQGVMRVMIARSPF